MFAIAIFGFTVGRPLNRPDRLPASRASSHSRGDEFLVEHLVTFGAQYVAEMRVGYENHPSLAGLIEFP